MFGPLFAIHNIPERYAFHNFEGEREKRVTFVSAFNSQRQSNKGKLSSNEVAKPPRLHIEHTHANDKTKLMRTFLVDHAYV